MIATMAERSTAARVIRALWRHRELGWELTKRDIADRYAGQLLGPAWAILHPIFLMSLYVFVFHVVFRVRFGQDLGIARDATVYILAGLIPWLTFQEVLARACTTVTANAGLVKQVVFPMELLPAKTVAAVFLTQLVAWLAFAVYLGVTPNEMGATYLLLPLLFAWQIMAMAGAAYILACLGAFFRDIKDVVTVFCAANLFLQPVLFQEQQVPGVFRLVLWGNPFSHLTWCYQDAIYYGSFSHPFSWLVVGFGAPLLLVFGAWLYERCSHLFGNVL